MPGYSTSDDVEPRPSSVTTAVMLALGMAAVELFGVYQVLSAVDELAGMSASERAGVPSTGFLVGASIFGFVLAALLVIGAVLAMLRKARMVLLVASAIVFGLAVMSLFNGNFLAVVSAVLAFITARLLRRDESKEYFESAA